MLYTNNLLHLLNVGYSIETKAFIVSQNMLSTPEDIFMNYRNETCLDVNILKITLCCLAKDFVENGKEFY